MLPGIGVGTVCGVACFPFECSLAVADDEGCVCGTIEFKTFFSLNHGIN